MRQSLAKIVMLLAVVSLSTVVRAQTPAPARPLCPTASQPEPPRPFRMQGNPYTMVQTETQTENYANGVTVTHVRTLKTARDSAGRTRDERLEEQFSGILIIDGHAMPPSESSGFVTVSDRAANQRMNWNFGDGLHRTVNVYQMGSSSFQLRRSPHPAVSQQVDNGPVAEQKTTQLGTKTVQGLILIGKRSTTEIPAHFDGNNVAYRTVSEIWISNELGGVQVESTQQNQRGKTERVLNSVTFGEPEPALFRPPADFEVKCTLITPGMQSTPVDPAER